MVILGIDTTCDDTSAGIVANGSQVLANVISSQYAAHEAFGGIVPMIAAREHTRQIGHIIRAAMQEAQVTFSDLDAVAVSNNQGLLLSLVVGVSAAKSIALACGIPLVGIHHLEGHIYSVLMAHEEVLRFPFLCLTVAGGHTLLLRVEDHGVYSLLGHTRDDAAGEAFDKVARRLGLGYPGGAAIEKLAKQGNAAAYAFPRPMITRSNLDFSFSGLKTAVMNLLDSAETFRKEDVAASFQQAVADVLVTKTLRAAKSEGLARIALAGGVAVNGLLRSQLTTEAAKRGCQVYLPAPSLCMDNGAMVAGAGYYLLRHRGADPLTIGVRANAPLGRLQVKYRHPAKYRSA